MQTYAICVIDKMYWSNSIRYVDLLCYHIYKDSGKYKYFEKQVFLTIRMIIFVNILVSSFGVGCYRLGKRPDY